MDLNVSLTVNEVKILKNAFCVYRTACLGLNHFAYDMVSSLEDKLELVES